VPESPLTLIVITQSVLPNSYNYCYFHNDSSIQIAYITVIMKKKVFSLRNLEKFSKELSGVFTTADLANIAGSANKIEANRFIKKLIKEGYIKQYIRGIYVVDKFSPEVLCSKIYPDSYISFGNVLATNLIIGSIPAKSIKAVRVGRNRKFSALSLRISYLAINSGLNFGFNVQENGVRVATPEKAFLDVLYFYLRGEKYSFNIFQDLNTERLNINLIKKYLKEYKNKKFVKFVNNYLAKYGDQ
jgi:predicted transcriptional regulator of viral defense system